MASWFDRNPQADFSVLIGQTLKSVTISEGKDRVTPVTEQGRVYEQLHYDDCCESVLVEDVIGNLDDLIGSPILMAEEAESGENPAGWEKQGYQDCFTWTFYKLATVKGYVTIRWYGTSNGYYSERVDFVECTREGVV